MRTKLPLIMAALIATALSLNAIELGDPAAPLKIAEWIKGKPVDLAAAKDKQIVVVEFWATWCPPCRTSIPHLTEMAKKFSKDVVFVGVSDEGAATVKPFVEKMGNKMDYVVALDKDNATGKGYMEAFGISGIPHAFIVDKQGRLVWHGHPMAKLGEVLESVISGKYDLAKEKLRDSARKKLEEFYELAGPGGNEAKADKLGKELEALDAELGGIEPGEKFNAAEVRKIIKFQSALRDYQTAISSGRSTAGLDKIEKQIEENAPKDFKLADFKEMMAANKLFTDYFMAAAGRGDKQKLPELAKQLAEVKIKDARMLNEWAWTLLTDKRIKTRDLELATKLAKAGVDASDAKEAAVLDTYARALFDSGKTAEAIEWQKKAIAAATEDQKSELIETLKGYEAKPEKK